MRRFSGLVYILIEIFFQVGGLVMSNTPRLLLHDVGTPEKMVGVVTFHHCRRVVQSLVASLRCVLRLHHRPWLLHMAQAQRFPLSR